MLVAKGKKQENFPANRTCDKLTRTVIRCDTFRAPQGEAGLAAHPVFFVMIFTEGPSIQVWLLTVFLYRYHLVLLFRVKNLIVQLQRKEKQTMYGKAKIKVRFR